MEELLKQQGPELPPSPPPPTHDHKYFRKGWGKMLLLFIIIDVIIIVGLYFFVSAQQTSQIQSIKDFESCAKAGFPIAESYPRQCHAGGKVFVEKVTSPTPELTCIPRPACLDATPRCMIPETSDMCPPNATPTTVQGNCTRELRACPDGSSVGRTGPNCEFSACPN